MKILRIAQHLYPEVTGGAPYHVHAMSRDQAAMGHDVTVVTVSGDTTLPRREEREGYSIMRARPTVELLGNEFAWGVWDELRDVHRYDIVHAHAHYYFSTLFAAIRRSIDDIPLAITNHGLYSQRAPEPLFSRYLQTLGRWTFDRADLIFCYNEADRTRVRELGVSSQITVVPNGIDTDRFTPTGPMSPLIDDDGPVILFVGRLVRGKRPEVALDAFSGVIESHPTAKLYVCGEGPLKPQLEQRVRERGLDESVTFLGQVPYDEMPAVYRGGDVLVVPSRAEGIPRTVMEALATGLQVISTDLPTIRSTFGDAVRYVDDGEPDELTAHLEQCVTDHQPPEFDAQLEWQHTVRATTTALVHACDR